MRQRQSQWVHEPPCCFTLQETDSEPPPRCRLLARSRPPCALYHSPRSSKRKEILPANKHGHPYASSRQTRTDHLTVDTSAEMAAVNREVEALLVRYEKTLSLKAGRTELDGGRARLSPEQQRLLAMDRPPLERLQDLPLEYLQPRKPDHLKSPVPSKARTERKPLLQSPRNPPRSESGEYMARMRKEMEAQGLVPRGRAANLKPIYANLQLDGASDIKIDFNGVSTSLGRSEQDKTTHPSPALFPLKSGVSVSTQTDKEQFIASPTMRREEGIGKSNVNDKVCAEEQKIENPTPGETAKNMNKNDNLLDQNHNYSTVVPPGRRDFLVYNTQPIFNALNKVKNYQSFLQNIEWKKSELMGTKAITNETAVKCEDDISQKLSLSPINTENKSTNSSEEKGQRNPGNLKNGSLSTNYSFIEEPNKTVPYTVENNAPNTSDIKCSSESKISLLRYSTQKFLEEHNVKQNVTKNKFKDIDNFNGQLEGGGDADLVLPVLPGENMRNVSPTRNPAIENASKPKSPNREEQRDTVQEQNKRNEMFSKGVEKKVDSSHNQSAFNTELDETSKIGKIRSKTSSGNENSVTLANVAFNTIGDKYNLPMEKTTTCSEIQARNDEVKETTKKENTWRSEGTSLNNTCGGKVVEGEQQFQQSEVYEQSPYEKGVSGLLKQLRADLLRHIEAEAKQIEVLNKCLEGVGAELESTVRTSNQENKIE